MEIPTIDPKDLAEFHRLHDEFKDLQEQASAALSWQEVIEVRRGGLGPNHATFCSRPPVDSSQQHETMSAYK